MENKYDYSQSLSTAHISTNLASYEAARSGFFTFIIDEKINNIIKATYKGNPQEAPETARYEKAQEAIKLNVVKCDVPNFRLEVLEYRRGNEKVKFAGVPNWADGSSLVVDDVVGLDTKGVLQAWKNLAYNVNTRKGGRMKDYKYNCTLVEYTQDYEPVRQWSLIGCWISDISEDPFDRENDGKRQINATIQYDRAILQDYESI